MTRRGDANDLTAAIRVYTLIGMSSTTVDLKTTRWCHCLAARKRARALTRLYDRYLRPHGLRSTQFSVLAVLAQRGAIPIRELGEILGLDRTSVTRSVAVLQRQGWVTEAPSRDARERRLAITPAGRERLEAALPDWHLAQRLVDEGREAAV